uniref:OBP24 n=1 Tax=Corythucha ciliata TaxID=369451 RepID=A0A3G2YUZ5_CORCT|nr:OBP24 [Corythucha ciliata]
MLVSTILLLFALKPLYTVADTTAKELNGTPVTVDVDAGNTAAPVETSTKEIDKRLFYKIKDVAYECATKNKINVADCLEMFDSLADLRQPKYHQCKCWIPCVARELNLMKDDDYDFEAIRGLIDQLETKPWRNEASRIFELCTDEGGTDCEGGFNILTCMMDHSDKAIKTAKHLLTAVKDDMN